MRAPCLDRHVPYTIQYQTTLGNDTTCSVGDRVAHVNDQTKKRCQSADADDLPQNTWPGRTCV